MVKINPKEVIEMRIVESMHLDKYKTIMEQVNKTNVSIDLDFQRNFNGFYRVRRNTEWRSAYYSLFEELKDKHPSFERILRAVYQFSGNVETSFSSKMLATIDPNMPIWDKYVAQNLCLELKGKTKEDQLQCAIELYGQMIEWYKDFIATENGQECIAQFEQVLPGYTWVSDVKKIDFFLWSIRE